MDLIGELLELLASPGMFFNLSTLLVQNLHKYQQLFNLLSVQGREIKEIAQELNLPLSTLKSQKARTLELLRTQLPHLGCFILLFWHNG